MLEIHKINRNLENSLSNFFSIITENRDDEYFHPHPLSNEEAKKIAVHNGQDAYYALVNNNLEILGYGMLRGFDQGYEIPSLAIIIHPDFRKKGLGHLLLSFLHSEAKMRNVSKIRLKVYPHNTDAYNLYKQHGYVFSEKENAQLIGFYDTGVTS